MGRFILSDRRPYNGGVRTLPLAVLLALAAATPAPAADTFDYVRVLETTGKGLGAWAGKFIPGTGEGELVGVRVVGDWWDGPGDPRVGDEKRSAATGIVWEVRRGDGPWTALPPATRDLRLLARSAAPAEAKAILGGSPAGEWGVRQTAGGEYPRSLRVEFTCRGDSLMAKDLRVASLMLPGLDPKPITGREYIPDRIDNPTLKPGAEIHAVVVVENCGARPLKEVDLDLLAVVRGRRQGKRIGFAQVPALEPGKTAELKIDGKIPADFVAESGSAEVLAFVNPRGTEREVETWNNALGRAFKYELPAKKEPLGGDLRDR
jgi:hypothetical protein